MMRSNMVENTIRSLCIEEKRILLATVKERITSLERSIQLNGHGILKLKSLTHMRDLNEGIYYILTGKTYLR